MATRKKRNPGKNKKRIKAQPKTPAVTEWDGYQLGQEVWVKLEIYGTEEWGFGSILGFYPKDSIEPSFDFFDKIRKRYATGAISNISDSPPKRWMNKR